MQEHPETNDQDSGEAHRNGLSLWGRVSAARLPLIIVGVVFLLLAFSEIERGGTLLLGFAATALVLLYLPIRTLRANRRFAASRRDPEIVWPDTQTKLFVEGLPEAALILDGEGLVRHTNSAMKQAFGTLVLGDPFTFKFRDPSILDAIEKVQKTNQVATVPYAVRFPSERRFSLHMSPIRLPRAAHLREDGSSMRPDFIFIVFFDQTERYRVDQLRSDFIANVSHELRTPIAALTGFIETLQTTAKDDREARERFLTIMLEQANRMTRLVNDLLSLSQIEMRSHLRPTGLVDLYEIVTSVKEVMQKIAEDAGMGIHITVQADDTKVVGDQDELIQVFQNLVENACKYGNDGDRIDIDIYSIATPPFVTQHKADWLCVEVRDNGEGIAPRHLPRLTERFYRADPEESKRRMGTGLGLSVVKHVLTRHHGDIKIESEAGKGATFKVFLSKSL